VFAAAPPDGRARGAGAPCALRHRQLAADSGALGGPACAAICAAFADAYDAAAAGFPDLLLWRDAPGDEDGARARACVCRALRGGGGPRRPAERPAARRARALLLRAGVRCCVAYVAAAPAEAPRLAAGRGVDARGHTPEL
jgi:hypothetical protein